MNRCIYCDKTETFTDEHVVSVGLGGDDKGWMLKDCVCENCNTKIFSKLEAAFLRSSPVAIARLFNQEKTRGRGGKTGTPSLNTKQSLLEDIEQGLFLNQELRQGFKPFILPQIVLATPGTLSAHLPDVKAGREFLSVLRTAIINDFFLIRKVKIEPEVHYERTKLTWDTVKYEFTISHSETIATLPKQTDGVIWVEELTMPFTAHSVCKLTPRIYRRSQGQLVCAVVNINDAPEVLSRLRENIDAIAISDDAEPVEIADKAVHLKFTMSVAVHDRILTKIGINLIAHLFGCDFVRRPEFAGAKDYALTGGGRILKINADKHITNQLSKDSELSGVHIFCILTANSGNDHTRILSVMASLYQGPFETFALADLHNDTFDLEDPIIVFVFYNKNCIEKKSISELRRMAEADGLGPVD